ncbi:MAG: hypothetical protein ABIH19_01575 [Candidatus Omnitrophota bacterium]
MSKRDNVVFLLSAYCTAVCIFVTQFCPLSWAFATSSFSDRFKLPAEYGIIKEVSEDTFAQDKPTIIHIQDAHCNYEAQKNMSYLLEYLVKQYGVKLIMVEGGSGDVGLSFLRAYADSGERVKVAEKYLKQGKISGEEYLDIISDYDLQLFGIEEEGLYEAHLVAFKTVDSIRTESAQYLKELSKVADKLKTYIYSDSLKELEKKERDYQEKTITLVEYCQFLKDAALVSGLSLDDYYHIASFAQTAKLEKEVDFKAAEAERNIFIKDLANCLDEEGIEELLRMSQGFKEKELTPYRYYSFLKQLSEDKITLSENYPQLETYISYIVVSGNINSADVLSQVNSVSEKIKGNSFTDQDEKKLSQISKAIGILSMLLNFELTPEDYDYFLKNRSDFSTSSWVSFIKMEGQRYGIYSCPGASSLIDNNLEKLAEFYKLGVEREKAFIKNLVKRMNQSGERSAVLITGGFHTPGITEMLKEKGYSYIVAMPVITEKSDSEVYFSVLRGER